MKKGNLTPKERKRLARLKHELRKLNAVACKHDLQESFAAAGDKLNSRWFNKSKEIERLTLKS